MKSKQYSIIIDTPQGLGEYNSFGYCVLTDTTGKELVFDDVNSLLDYCLGVSIDTTTAVIEEISLTYEIGEC